jgi:hypothetical protein
MTLLLGGLSRSRGLARAGAMRQRVGLTCEEWLNDSPPPPPPPPPHLPFAEDLVGLQVLHHIVGDPPEDFLLSDLVSTQVHFDSESVLGPQEVR